MTILYGFHQLETIFDERLTDENIPEVNDAIVQATEEHNSQLDALLGLFARRTTDYKLRYKTTSNARLQPLDENGRARPIAPSGFYDVAFPLQGGGIAWGANRVTRIKMTVEEVARNTNTMLVADRRWMRDHVLAALFANASWSFNDKEHGGLTIKGLANGDTDTYQILAGADAAATDNHYLFQNAIISDANDPFGTIHDELTEHPENGGEVVSLIPTNVKEAVEGLTAFNEVADPNITRGNASDILTGDLGIALPGDIIGYHDSRVWLVEWRSMPDNFVISLTTEGEPPLALREHEEAELQGFQFVGERNDHPYSERHWERHAGFGAWNRVGAVVMEINDTEYAVPTNYGSPMP